MKTQFGKIKSFFVDFASAKQAHAAALEKIENQRSTYSEDYTRKQIDQEKANWKSYQETAHEKFLGLIEETTTALSAKRAVFSGLTDPRFQAALALIEATGGKLPAETTRQLVSQFSGAENYQNALALRAVFQAKGVQYIGDLDQMLYETRGLENLSGQAYATFLQGASLNQLSYQVGKFAALEGVVDWPSMVDGDLMTAARAGAGLPEK